MRKKISYIFTIPACILFYIAEKILGEKITWIAEESLKKIFNNLKIETKCPKCGHIGKFKL